MQRPVGLTIIGVLGIVRGVVEALVGLLFEFGSALVARRAFGLPGFLLSMGAAMVGIILLLLGAFYIAAGVGLLNLRNWARVTCIVLAAIGLVLTLLGAPARLFLFRSSRRFLAALVDALILWYLWRSDIKRVFQGPSHAAPAAPPVSGS